MASRTGALVDVVDGEGDGLGVDQVWGSVVGDDDIEGVGAVLGFGWCPGEVAGGRVDCGAGWDGSGERVGENVGGNVAIRCTGRECEEHFLVTALRPDGVEHGGIVDRCDNQRNCGWARAVSGGIRDRVAERVERRCSPEGACR